jgi:peptide/nickel transport system substrate-binding protein
MAEFLMGSRSRLGNIGAFRDFMGRRFTWAGAFMAFVTIAIMFYYAVVTGWCIRYFTVAATGAVQPGIDGQAYWDAFIGNPVETIGFHFIAVAISAVVVFRGIKSDPSRVAALLAGDVDLIDEVPATDMARLKKEPKVTIAQTVSNRIIYLHLDHFRDDSPFVQGKDGKPIKNPLRDARVRRAISMAIDRDAIVSRVMEGQAIKAGQLLPEGFFGVSKKLKPVGYDPNGAKKLLAEAGVPNGFRLTIHSPNDRYPNDAKIAEAVGQMLSRIGIDTQVVTMTQGVFFRDASTGSPEKGPKFSFILVGWGSGTGEASSPLKSLIATFDREKGMGASNRGRYSNPQVDKLINDALATVDDTKRAEILAHATEVAIEDVAIIPLHYQVNTWAMRRGFSYKPRTDEYTLATGVGKAN